MYNAIGEEIAITADGFYEAGYHEVIFKASNLSSGVYLYKIEYEGLTQMRKMLLLE